MTEETKQNTTDGEFTLSIFGIPFGYQHGHVSDGENTNGWEDSAIWFWNFRPVPWLQEFLKQKIDESGFLKAQIFGGFIDYVFEIEFNDESGLVKISTEDSDWTLKLSFVDFVRNYLTFKGLVEKEV